MRYLSVCAGIEAATVAWHHMGWQAAAYSEIEPFPSAVLQHHYPDVPKVGDMTKYKEWDIGSIDLLVGGTPCQSFSVAGLRKGMADPRGNLALVYCGILDHFRPKWFIWENVPGVLSSNGGRDFGSFLGALAQLGYGFAYRVLDAQFFGVAQRRRRVFVVGHLGDWRRAASVLFEPTSLRRDTAPSREKGERVAPSISTGAPFSRTGNERVECDAIVPAVANCLETTCNDYSRADGFNMIGQPIPYDLHQVTAPVNRQAREPGDPCHTLAKQNAHNAGIVQPINFSSQMSVPQVDFDLCQTLGAKNPQAAAQPVGFTRCDHGGDAVVDGTPTMRCGSNYSAHLAAAIPNMAVRRLTPVECERLQGFPDRYTEIPWRKKEQTPDGPRYKALGNSMAVPVMRWIGERINGQN